ncbi:MAG: ATP-binding protein, partial [Clostridia bacterium]|nr:ATP-binding protein [Clostridia bacterium]
MAKVVDVTRYRPRIIDDTVDKYLKTFGAVCITGPKWCEKSWTASYHCNSEFMVHSPAANFRNRTHALVSPEMALEGDTPRLIDEWQDVPALWDAVRYEVDSRGKKGQFILTGSSSPKNLRVMHYGTGRIARLQMRTMSLFETGDSDGSVSLQELCNGQINQHMTESIRLDKLARLIVRGGWPENLEGVPDVTTIPSTYADDIVKWDTRDTDGVRYNAAKLRLLLKSLARNVSTTVSMSTLQHDVVNDADYDGGQTSGNGFTDNTVSRYLDYLNRMYVVENIPPFSLNMRSAKRIKRAEKRHFCDVSLTCALLNATPQMLLEDFNTFGFLFEELCAHDLRIYAESFGAQIYHYQDYGDREIDAVIELRDGRWCGFEIKLGANQIASAAENLL